MEFEQNGLNELRNLKIFDGVEGVPKVTRRGKLKDGRIWVKIKGIRNAQSITTEVINMAGKLEERPSEVWNKFSLSQRREILAQVAKVVSAARQAGMKLNDMRIYANDKARVMVDDLEITTEFDKVPEKGFPQLRQLQLIMNDPNMHQSREELANELNQLAATNKAMNTNIVSNEEILTPKYLEVWESGQDETFQDEARPQITQLPSRNFPKSLSEKDSIPAIDENDGRVNIVGFDPYEGEHGSLLLKKVGSWGMSLNRLKTDGMAIVTTNNVYKILYQEGHRIYLLDSNVAKELMKEKAEKKYDKTLVPFIFALSLLKERLKEGNAVGKQYQEIYDSVAIQENHPEITVSSTLHQILFDSVIVPGTLEESLPIAKKVLLKIYEETGEDLVKTGVMNSLSSATPYAWPYRGDSSRFLSLNNVDWVSDNYYRPWLWENGLQTILNPMIDQELITQYEQATKNFQNLFLGTYIPKRIEEHGTDQLTQDILSMKKVRDEKSAEEIVNKYADQIREKIGKGIDLIIPVPKDDQADNHMAYVAQALGSILNIDVNIDALLQVKSMNEQKVLDYWERLKNIIHIFDVPNKDSVKDKTVVIIDDVYTSGATMESARNALYKAGAKKVIIFAFGWTKPISFHEMDQNRENAEKRKLILEQEYQRIVNSKLVGLLQMKETIDTMNMDRANELYVSATNIFGQKLKKGGGLEFAPRYKGESSQNLLDDPDKWVDIYGNTMQPLSATVQLLELYEKEGKGKKIKPDYLQTLRVKFEYVIALHYLQEHLDQAMMINSQISAYSGQLNRPKLSLEELRSIQTGLQTLRVHVRAEYKKFSGHLEHLYHQNRDLLESYDHDIELLLAKVETRLIAVDKNDYVDEAMLAQKASGPGGIDLTANRMNLDIASDKGAVSQPMDLKALENIEINGLYIKDIEIKPLKNLPELLGVPAS
jgi:hypoxanthine-guanine phosphoribosyltransferase